MNIALISREFPPFTGGGIGTYTRQSACALAEAGHRPVVVTVSPDGRETEEQTGGVTVVRLPFISGDDWSRPHPAIATPAVLAAFRTFVPESAFAMQVAAALPRLIARFRIDAVEAPDTGALAWFALGARRTGRPWVDQDAPPLVCVVHSPTAWVDALNRQPRPTHTLLSQMERDSARWCDGLVSPSRALADWAVGHWGLAAGSVAVIPYALGALEPLAHRSLASEGVAVRPPHVLYVGRLEPRKGVDTLLAGWSRVRTSGAHLELVGQDMPDPCSERPFGATCLEAIGSGARATVALRGRMTPHDIERLRDAIPIAVVPSPDDNFPYACLEAMAAGQLIVAARAGGMAELIRHGVDGLLFDAGDDASCAEALARAISLAPAEQAALGRAGARRVLEVCGNDRITRERVRHFEGVIARRSATPAPTVPACELVCLNGAGLPAPVLTRLAEAASQAGIDFAHGWTRVGEGAVAAFATPAPQSLAGAPRPLGPILVRRTALDRLGLGDLEPVPAESPWPHRRVPSTWSVAAALCAAGSTGCVVPDCIAPLPARPRPNGAAAP